MRTSSRGAGRGSRGMTLVELLIAFVVLLMLVTALVALSTKSLETWSSGEARKELYDRAEVVLSAVADDLRNLYAENEVYFNGRQDLPAPALQCDEDPHRNPRIRFVRTGAPAVIRAQGPSAPPPTRIPPMDYGPTWEVAYVLDPDPEKAVLWRGSRGFDRRTTGSLLRAVEYQREEDPLFRQCFTPVESGILYVGYDFWTQYTTTWDDAAPLQAVKPGSKQAVGPSPRWDSTRRQDTKFFFHRRQLDPTNPDYVYPEIVRITVVVEGDAPDRHGVRVTEVGSSYLQLTHTRGIVDPPGMVKVGGEWIEYHGKTDTQLMQIKRARRGTVAGTHAPGTPVRFGETFTTEVRIPVYRAAQEP